MGLKTCSQCGKTFSNTRSNALYCSPQCRNKARNKRRNGTEGTEGNTTLPATEPKKIKKSILTNRQASTYDELVERYKKYKDDLLKSEEEFNFKGVHYVGKYEIHEKGFEFLVAKELIKMREGKMK